MPDALIGCGAKVSHIADRMAIDDFDMLTWFVDAVAPALDERFGDERRR